MYQVQYIKAKMYVDHTFLYSTEHDPKLMSLCPALTFCLKTPLAVFSSFFLVKKLHEAVW